MKTTTLQVLMELAQPTAAAAAGEQGRNQKKYFVGCFPPILSVPFLLFIFSLSSFHFPLSCRRREVDSNDQTQLRNLGERCWGGGENDICSHHTRSLVSGYTKHACSGRKRIFDVKAQGTCLLAANVLSLLTPFKNN